MGAPTGKTPPVAAVVRPASPEVGREPEGPPTSQDVNEALGATAAAGGERKGESCVATAGRRRLCRHRRRRVALGCWPMEEIVSASR